MHAQHVLVLNALVDPSQLSPDEEHKAWVSVNRVGTIVIAHCTCIAG